MERLSAFAIIDVVPLALVRFESWDYDCREGEFTEMKG